MNKSKKIISVLAAATMAVSALALTGCESKGYKGDKLTAGYVSEATVSSNGGFVVEKGEYVYFINGKEVNTASNTYGDVVKGALMRIAKSDLASGNYAGAQIVVPELFVTGNYDSGIYVYGDYVYYATPTKDKDNKGQIVNSSLDFKRAKIDGSSSPMDGKNTYLFRLTTNTAKYRFVEVDGTVYCLYEDSSKLKSYNVKTGETTVLVSGAGTFIYDTQDLTNPNVYYTMGVTYDLDKTTSTSASYNQIYCVNAATTVTVDVKNAKYTAKLGDKEIASYDFDERFMKENAEEKKYDLAKHDTYPYVNLGQLVLDGVSKGDSPSNDNRFNVDSKADADEFGYTYTIQSQANGGIYFTRKQVVTNSSETNSSETAKLYYVKHDEATADDWNTVTGNKDLDIVATNTTNASASALYAFDGTSHSYIYVSGTMIKKATGSEDVTIAYGVASGSTLWKTEGDYLYYYGTGTNGKNITRLNYTGNKSDYEFLGDEDKFAPVQLSLVDWSDSWYKPEFVTAGDKQLVLYPNAQSFGSAATAYSYIYAADLGKVTENNEKVEKVNEYIDGYSSNAELQAAMKYFYRTGSTEKYEEVKDLYSDYQQKEFTTFVEKFAEGGEFNGMLESNVIGQVGKLNKKDAKEISEAWTKSLKTEKVEDEDEKGLPVWAIVLICVGGALVIAGGTVAVILVLKNKKAKKEKEEAIVNAYKHKKIDTTDDKSIDVYEDEKVEETATEESVIEEAPVEETAEEEAVAEEETPVDAE